MKKKIILGCGVVVSVIYLIYVFCYKDNLVKVNYDSYNVQIEKGIEDNMEWVLEVDDIVTELIGPLEGEGTKRTVKVEGIKEKRVELIDDGINDDSIRAVKYIFYFDKDDNGNWYITKILWGQKAWRGRGIHTKFSGTKGI